MFQKTFNNNRDFFLWLLFTEGIVMYFEQTSVGETNYYHQDKDDWGKLFDRHLENIKDDFNRNLETLTLTKQLYFGDLVKYNGHSDMGYYLGCQLVRYILSEHKISEIICFDIHTVSKLFNKL